MFNQNIKERYIEEKYFTTTLPKGYLECQFNKLEEYEKEYDKDVCCFTTREIRDLVMDGPYGNNSIYLY